MKNMSLSKQHCRNVITRKMDYRIMVNAIVRCGTVIVASDHRPHVAQVQF